jgi:oligosaccharide repeat unit polymerase
MIYVLILFIILLVGGIIVSKDNIVAPSVITPLIWVFCLLLFLLLKHGLFPLKPQFLLSISLWVFLFAFAAMTMQSIKFTTNVNFKPSKIMMDVYFWLSVAAFPFMLIFAQKAIATGETGFWATDLRQAALGLTAEFKQGYGGLHIILWQVAYMIELFFYSKKNRHRVFILGFFLLCYAFLTMSKYSFLDLFLKTICILYFIKKINVKHIAVGIAVLFVLFIGLQSLRQNIDMSPSEAKTDFVSMYILSSMPAFDTVEPESSQYFGENSLRAFYSILNKFGLSPHKPSEVILEWTEVPTSTNIYTGLYPFFKDFGYWGVGIFGLILGSFFGWLFKKYQQGSVFFAILYAYFFTALVIQFSSEVFFTHFNGHIIFAFLLFLPFFMTRYKFFEATAE